MSQQRESDPAFGLAGDPFSDKARFCGIANGFFLSGFLPHFVRLAEDVLPCLVPPTDESRFFGVVARHLLAGLWRDP